MFAVLKQTNKQNMTTLSILQTLTTDELKASGLAEKWYANFGMEHLLKADLIRMEKYNPVYYVVAADAQYNYGLDFNIYALYMSPDGIKFFKQFEYSCCIHNGGLRQVWIYDENHVGINEDLMQKCGIEPNIIKFGDVYYDKSPAHRARLAKASQQLGYIFN